MNSLNGKRFIRICFMELLKCELERIWAKGMIMYSLMLMLKGGINLKKKFGTDSIAIFIMPPSVDELENRLIKRATDSPEKIKIRIEKAKEELKLADQFDTVIVNHQLDQAKDQVQIVTSFLERIKLT